MNEESYPQFYVLFGGYLNQDSDLWGDTLEEVVSCFKRDSSPQEIADMLCEIDKFEQEAGENLDEKFYAAYGFDFNPILWGYTTASFFDELRGLLRD
ncbi:contact-dependent growth inhibition system immunity protein [Paraburkholderia susongensis]|nr:contact-dependent growth inhibition system immunity protein [Paraburkholderia susongensis]